MNSRGLNPILREVARIICGAIPDASYDDAVKYFRKAIELAPNRVAHHVELGRTYAALGQADSVRIELNEGLALPTKEKDAPGTKERAKLALRSL